MGHYYISQENFRTFLDGLSNAYTVFIPVKKGEKRSFRRYEKAGGYVPVVGEVRTVEPLKAFFFRSRQKVAEGFQDNLPGANGKPFCLVGVKACDLHGLRLLDKVFISDDYVDPFYANARQDNLIIASDCTLTAETCYCGSFHHEPYPQEDFDLNLSEINGGYIVEDGSKKGAETINQKTALFSAPDSQALTARDEQRTRVKKEVADNIQRTKTPDKEMLEGVIQKNYEDSLWEEEAQTCVECGACNIICPTCHCFLLYDQKDNEALARFRIWDSCMLKNFARVAGGANPRKALWMRLRNRFEKKFDFAPKVLNTYACTGCGRCISACPAKIDIRSVLRRLVDNVQEQ